jgi:hypothetical protein
MGFVFLFYLYYICMLGEVYAEKEREEEAINSLSESLLEMQKDPQISISQGSYLQWVHQIRNFQQVNFIQIEKTIIEDAFTKVVETLLPDAECAICYDKFQVGEYKTDINCHHSFHYRCLIEWGKQSTSCPLCRYPFRVLFVKIKLDDEICP